MKFNFKIQSYQTDAVKAVVRVFEGQGFHDHVTYRRDLGDAPIKKQGGVNFNHMDFGQMSMIPEPVQGSLFDDVDETNETGYRNEDISLSDDALLEQIRTIQGESNIRQSPKLIKDKGRCALDIEMETGTGKTYVYIKTMFELNEKYGWSKFIVVVPSIAIREGVKKSFEITEEHFMQHYGKKARYFIYNSKNLNQLDNFSSNGGINVMIINTQAFATSLKEGAKNKESRIIYDRRDEFQSRRPIDVIRANRPILILDEPQKMGGDATQKALKNFNPLFTLSYSATHAKENNMIYVLDALEAYNKKLVKKIEVKGFEVKNLRGTDNYLYLEGIILSAKKPPAARIELEIGYKSGVKRENRVLNVGDNLYITSQEMEQYKGYVVSLIDPTTSTVTFTNGETITRGEVVGDVSERDMRRIQIRETILSHFEKEERLFVQGIKTLSLFFIDEVAKYRQYDEDGEETLGEYGRIFEEEYFHILNGMLTIEDSPYQRYLRQQCSDIADVHRGYFSIDKKTGKSVNSDVKRGSEFSDDISAYDLILKNKERLLSFEEPTRFIFSHSALREGWDNPNVFQICTLKHSDSKTAKRQEVGRGLRLCVNADGSRMDRESCGDENVHKINMLTVIASESYRGFVTDLQAATKDVLYNRPTKATMDYFEGKSILVAGEQMVITPVQAKAIYKYLIKNDYIDDDDGVSDSYRADVANQMLAPLPLDLTEMSEGVHNLVQAIYDDSILADMFSNGNETRVNENPLNDNFYKKEFQALWNCINHKYAYTVSFDSEELIQKSIEWIDEKLFVSRLQYTTSVATQKDTINEHQIGRGESFGTVKTKTRDLDTSKRSAIKYDLVGKIAVGATLTRKTVVAILKGIRVDKLAMFKLNPEEFILKVTRLIKEQKASMVIRDITYNPIEGTYDDSIFTAGQHAQTVEKAFRAEHHIQDYVFTDGTAEKSIERTFAEVLDGADEVVVYAKLPSGPNGFYIPTPVGNYSPDWAIAFREGTVKHIYFIAETKGSMQSMQLKEMERAKIDCAKALFNRLSNENLRYDSIDNYQHLLDVMGGVRAN